MKEGWKCPNCGGAHGPHVDSCPVPSVSPTPSPTSPGITPFTPPREWYPTPVMTGDPTPIWPVMTCGVVCKPDPNLISVN